MTIAVLCEQDEEGFYISSLQCILDHLQSRRYPQGEEPGNEAPLKSRDKLLKSINVVAYLLDKSYVVHRLTAASTFSLTTSQSHMRIIPEDAVRVGSLEVSLNLQWCLVYLPKRHFYVKFLRQGFTFGKRTGQD